MKMKIIFLDIDGVLNSEMYSSTQGENKDCNYIDLSRVKLLADIVNATDAKIVLTSTFRLAWDKSPHLCGNDGKYINECLAKYGLDIMDATPFISIFASRRKEVLTWLSHHLDEVESFVILDDIDDGWEEFDGRVVITNPMGYGLEEEHVQKAIELLKV